MLHTHYYSITDDIVLSVRNVNSVKCDIPMPPPMLQMTPDALCFWVDRLSVHARVGRRDQAEAFYE